MSAKEIILRLIPAKVANDLVRRLHYSGKVVNNSQVHIGVYYRGKLEGAMQFGPSLDKRKLIGLVDGTLWNEFIELNRMAFSDALPRNSESRALGVAMRILRKHAPQLKWVVSFADGTQCGDGTIYRAAGFVLASITESKSLWRMAGGEIVHEFAFRIGGIGGGRIKRRYGYKEGENRLRFLKANAEEVRGFQLRYLYFLDPTARQRLTCPILPFSEIEKRGAGMYKGKPRERAESGNPPQEETAVQTRPARSIVNFGKPRPTG